MLYKKRKKVGVCDDFYEQNDKVVPVLFYHELFSTFYHVLLILDIQKMENLISQLFFFKRLHENLSYQK